MTTASCTTKPLWIYVGRKRWCDLKKDDVFIFAGSYVNQIKDFNKAIHNEEVSLYVATSNPIPITSQQTRTDFNQVRNSTGELIGAQYYDYPLDNLRELVIVKQGTPEEAANFKQLAVINKIKYLDMLHEQRKQLCSQKGSVPKMQPSR